MWLTKALLGKPRKLLKNTKSLVSKKVAFSTSSKRRSEQLVLDKVDD